MDPRSHLPQPLLRPDGPCRWRIDAHGRMRVPGIVFATAALVGELDEDCLRQVANVAELPGIVGASYAMPDAHWGYGFPIGGVAATDVEAGGVVSPGGVGFDISCGVRLLASPLTGPELAGRIDPLMDAMDKAIPRGLGPGGVWKLSHPAEMDQVLLEGARYAVAQGHGTERDLERCEDAGALEGADPAAVSAKALERGRMQIGSLGAGNHFLEVQVVDQVIDTETARLFGLFEEQVCVMIHSGSRGLGHQVCTDHVRGMQKAMARHGISVPDRQLACAPVDSDEGRGYLAAMAAAANFGRANRQLLAEAARKAFDSAVQGAHLDLIYDVSHNLAKIERHNVDGTERLVCVHRKGATRAFPPGHADLPPALTLAGQPVLVPGSMGTASWVLAGGSPGNAFHSSCHGAGRRLSRTEARRTTRGEHVREQLERAGVHVRPRSLKGLAEEMPAAYKDVDEVIAACDGAGLTKPVARLVPVGVVKG